MIDDCRNKSVHFRISAQWHELNTNRTTFVCRHDFLQELPRRDVSKVCRSYINQLRCSTILDAITLIGLPSFSLGLHGFVFFRPKRSRRKMQCHAPTPTLQLRLKLQNSQNRKSWEAALATWRKHDMQQWSCQWYVMRQIRFTQPLLEHCVSIVDSCYSRPACCFCSFSLLNLAAFAGVVHGDKDKIAARDSQDKTRKCWDWSKTETCRNVSRSASRVDTRQVFRGLHYMVDYSPLNNVQLCSPR